MEKFVTKKHMPLTLVAVAQLVYKKIKRLVLITGFVF